METTETFNLATGECGPIYTLAPEKAVVVAHAQSLGDFNTWTYFDGRYEVIDNGLTVRCGDFTAWKTDGGFVLTLHRDVQRNSECGGQVSTRGKALFGVDYWCVYCGAKFDADPDDD